ncbi:MAG: hypothetical protein OCD02_05300 [Spirochaetaceae bacterium]
MLKKLPLIMLLLSILCLILSVLIVFKGSSKSNLYKQMSNANIIKSLFEVNKSNSSFLIYGKIKEDHNTIKDNLVAYNNEKPKTPNLTVSLNDGEIMLFSGYGIADYNTEVIENGSTYRGIKAGSDITIFALKYLDGTISGIKGYELYPGMPKQYLNFLYSPYISYMIYVRIFIALALLFFTLSAVLNIKK